MALPTKRKATAYRVAVQLYCTCDESVGSAVALATTTSRAADIHQPRNNLAAGNTKADQSSRHTSFVVATNFVDFLFEKEEIQMEFRKRI